MILNPGYIFESQGKLYKCTAVLNKLNQNLWGWGLGIIFFFNFLKGFWYAAKVKGYWSRDYDMQTSNISITQTLVRNTHSQAPVSLFPNVETNRESLLQRIVPKIKWENAAKCLSWCLEQASANFFCKRPDDKYWGFVGHLVSATTALTQFWFREQPLTMHK